MGTPPFVVDLRLILLIYAGLTSCEALITCEAGTFEAGKPAFITCNFRTNITTTRQSLNMARYPMDAPKNAIGIDILLCRWSVGQQHHACFVEQRNYTFDGVLTDRLTVRIPSVSFGQQGLYMCFFVPPEGTDAHPCELTVVPAKPEGSTTDLPSDETAEDQDVLPIVLPVVVVSLLCAVVGLFLYLFIRRRRLQWAQGESHHELSEKLIPLQRRQAETLLEEFKLSNSTLKELMRLLDQEMCKGLEESTRAQADVKMFPTSFSRLSDLSKYLVVSLASGKLRLFLVELQKQHGKLHQSVTHPIPPNVKGGTGRQLFNFIVDCVKTFLQNHKVVNVKLPLVLMVAYPCKDQSLKKADVAKWAREFKSQGVVLRDLHFLLYETLLTEKSNKDEKGRYELLNKVELVSVVNDTVSTLVSAAHSNPHCKIGLLVGSRLNACYVEDRMTDVEMECSDDDKPNEMIINAELGTLGENGCLDVYRSSIDRELDENSSNPGSHILQKMVGGLYIGEIVRLVLEKLTKEGVLFRDAPLGCDLFQKDTFSMEFVVVIDEEQEEGSYPKTTGILDVLGVSKHSDEDLKTVRRVCKHVFERAACITAASLAALINRVNQPEVTVVVDGYLFRRHPRFHDLMYHKTLELVKPGLKFFLVSPRRSPDPVGAARIAAAALTSRKAQPPSLPDTLQTMDLMLENDHYA